MQAARICDVLSFLNESMPFESAESYDNVGLIVGNQNTKITKILCALDCTPAVVDEAREKNANLIISHHPLMFRAINKIDPKSYEGCAISKLLKNDISLISVHTNLDKSPLSPGIMMARRLDKLDVDKFDNYIAISQLNTPISEDELIDNVKSNLSPTPAFYGRDGRKIQRIAFGGGACSDAYMIAKNHSADILITGEVKHNHALEAVHEGVKILEIGHYYSEVLLIEGLCEYLQTKLNALQYKVTVEASAVVPF